MKPGEEYVNISLTVGKVLELAEQAKQQILEQKTHVSIAAFPVEIENGPAFKAEGVAVWKQKKKEEAPKPTEENVKN